MKKRNFSPGPLLSLKHFAFMLCLLLISSAYCFGQKTSSFFLPELTAKTPAFFKVFYQKDFPSGINVFELDRAVADYLHQTNTHQKDLQDAGEENEDIYLLYYKRWRKAIDYRIENDGSIGAVQETQSATTVSSSAKTSASSAWQLIGPVETFWRANDNPLQPPCPWQINIYSCAIAPSNTNVLYAGAETDGIYTTTDKGLHWQLCLDDNHNYTALAVDPGNSSIAYGGGNNVVSKTSNAGVSWTSTAIASGDINGLAINPLNTSEIYAATANGLFKSVNGGSTWNIIAGISNPVYDVFLKTNDPNTVFILQRVGTQMEFWKSVNGGNSFSQSMSGWTPVSSHGARMTVSPADSARLYVVVLADTPAVQVPHIYKSNDAGQNWTLQCTGTANSLTGNANMPLGMSNGQGYYDLAILANPQNANEVLVASTTAYKSTDGGATFNRFGGYGGNFPIHPDIQCMVAVGGDTWISTDGGMNYSTDFFTSPGNHTARNNGLYGSDFWGYAQGWNEDYLAGGRYHNGNTVFSEYYTAGNALRLGGGEAPTGYYMVGHPGYIAFSDIGDAVVPNTFNGMVSNFSFNKYPNEDGYGFDASEVEFLPYCNGVVYTGEGNELWKSVNGGVSWTSVHNFNERVKKFEISRSNPDVIYLATASHVYKTIDGGITWTQLSMPSGTSYYNLEIAVDFSDENKLWFTAPGNSSNNRVFKSVNGGSTWINLTTPTINGSQYRNIVHHAGTDGGVYIFSKKNGNVFYRNNTMSDWMSYSTSYPVGVTPLKSTAFYRDGKLRSCGNKGIWQVDLYENVAPVAQPTVDKLTSDCPRDTFYFEDYSALNHAGASWNWSFSPAPAYVSSATVRNPKVVFGTQGTYDFALTVSNAQGSSSKSIIGKIQVNGNVCGVDTIPGKALQLVNAGDYAETTTPLNINTNTLTFSCWIKPDSIQPAWAGIITSASGGACNLNFMNNNRIGYHWNNSANSYNWTNGPIVPANEWSHVALVVSPTSVKVYLNGLAYTNNVTVPAVNFNSPVQIGIDRSNTARNFKGLIDEVCIYNRSLSTNEIRELMNLTRNNPNAGSLPQYDNSLISYYQFNENNSLPCYDKVQLSHAFLTGTTANKNINSSAPVGGGTFERQNVNAGGNYNFSLPAVQINFPSTGTYPNGDVVVTRINVPSDQLCGNSILPNTPSYYVIRNYGSNATFSALANLQFDYVWGTTAAHATNPNSLKLYKRLANQDGATWIVMDSADIVSNNAAHTVSFSTGLSLTAFGQFSIANDLDSILLSSAQEEPLASATELLLMPNPSNDGWVAMQLTGASREKNALVSVYNELGQEVKRFSLKEEELKKPVLFNLPVSGIYFVTVRTSGNQIFTKKIVVL